MIHRQQFRLIYSVNFHSTTVASQERMLLYGIFNLQLVVHLKRIHQSEVLKSSFVTVYPVAQKIRIAKLDQRFTLVCRVINAPIIHTLDVVAKLIQ